MTYEHFLFFTVIVCFSVIHFIEVSSYLARLSGVENGSNALAYATQSAVSMATRFFSMLLLPILGLIIDLHVSKEAYLLVVGLAIAGAFVATVFALCIRGRLVSGFGDVVLDVGNGGSLMWALAKMPWRVFRAQNLSNINIGGWGEYFGRRIFWLSAIVFSIYATSIFIAFYFGLVFPKYRTSISQLSAVSNAFATVLLTFFVEPKISMAIDKGDAAGQKMLSMLFGRAFGLGGLACIPILALWFFV